MTPVVSLGPWPPNIRLNTSRLMRSMSGVQKWRTAFGLYWSARKLKAARVREQHPDWSEAQVQQQVKEIFMHAVT